MAAGHLQRTGYRHLVLAIAALSALVAGMYTQSSFIDPLLDTTYLNPPILSDAYTKLHRFASAVIALNIITCVVTSLMSVVVDWHFAIRTPAYIEFSWVGLAWCVEVVSVILAGVSAPDMVVCSLNETPFGTNEIYVMLGKRICSNWTAVLVTSVMSLIAFTFHFMWHLVFRLWHRAALTRRPTSPIDLWNTPLPKHYPISPCETQIKKDDPVFLALEDSPRGVKPEDSIIMDPYSLLFRPVAVRNAGRAAQEGAKVYEVPVVNVTAPIEDQGADNASQTILHIPPGLVTKTNDHPPHPPSGSD